MKRLIILMSQTLSTKEVAQAAQLSERTVHRVTSAHRQGIPFEKAGNRGGTRKLNNWDLDVSTINHSHLLISLNLPNS
jgi:transposase